MPQRKKPVEPAEPVADATSQPAPVKPIGHIPAPRWVRTTSTLQEETDESLAFSCEINVAGLSQGNTTWLWEPTATLGDLWNFFAGRVRAWNATTIDRESGEWVIAQGPDAVGWTAFPLVDAQYTTFLLLMLNDAINGGDARPKSVPS